METAIGLENLFKILAALLLVALNGLFVAAEFAFVKVRPTRIAQLAEQGNRKAIRTQACISHLDQYLSVSQLGITLASLGLGWLGEPAIADLIRPLFLSWGIQSTPLLHSISFILAFSIITFLHVVFGELAPKTLAIQRAESLSMLLSGPMKLFFYLFYPGVAILNGTANKFLLLLGLELDGDKEGIHSEEELRMLISNSYQQGQIRESEQELLQNVFKFEKRVAEEIMVPRPDVVFLNTNLSLEENLQTSRSARHTRYPLCDGNPDHILGIIHIKDIFTIDDQLHSLEDLTRPTLFVPETMRLDNLLQEFRKRHQHMGIVIDEYGGTSGIVTMDNILEKLVGDIQDEFDQEEPDFRLQEDGSLTIDGRMYIDEAIEELGLVLHDENEEYNTLAGYVLGQLGKLPQIGDSIQVGQHRLEVEQMKGMRIERLRLTLLPEDLNSAE